MCAIGLVRVAQLSPPSSLQNNMVGIKSKSLLFDHSCSANKLTLEHHHRWYPHPRLGDGHGYGGVLTVVCRGAHVHRFSAAAIYGDEAIHWMIVRSLIHIHGEVLMTIGIIHTRDLQ